MPSAQSPSGIWVPSTGLKTALSSYEASLGDQTHGAIGIAKLLKSRAILYNSMRSFPCLCLSNESNSCSGSLLRQGVLVDLELADLG
jgi:hypothetical protein